MTPRFIVVISALVCVSFSGGWLHGRQIVGEGRVSAAVSLGQDAPEGEPAVLRGAVTPTGDAPAPGEIRPCAPRDAAREPAPEFMEARAWTGLADRWHETWRAAEDVSVEEVFDLVKETRHASPMRASLASVYLARVAGRSLDLEGIARLASDLEHEITAQAATFALRDRIVAESADRILNLACDRELEGRGSLLDALSVRPYPLDRLLDALREGDPQLLQALFLGRVNSLAELDVNDVQLLLAEAIDRLHRSEEEAELLFRLGDRLASLRATGTSQLSLRRRLEAEVLKLRTPASSGIRALVSENPLLTRKYPLLADG